MRPVIHHITSGNLAALPANCGLYTQDGIDYAAVKEAGYTGLQHYFPDEGALQAGLEMSGIAKVERPGEALATAQQHADWGFVVSSWHVGTGFETDAEMDALAGAVLEAAAATGLKILIETHRATITQDMRRTLDLIERFPDIRFTADYSHWYTGHEMRYGDWARKIDALSPVFERVRCVQGRIGHSCTAQLPLAQAKAHPHAMKDYEEFWSRSLQMALPHMSADDHMIFMPELLPAQLEFAGQQHYPNYAQLQVNSAGELGETTDRWAEAIELSSMFDSIADHVTASSTE